jgi:predicted PurR-regulated permease PerM
MCEMCEILATERYPVHPVVDRLAAYSWRLLVIAAAGVGILWLIGRLWVGFLALVLVVLLARLLAAPAARLRSLGWPPAVVALFVLLGFLVALGAALTLVGMAVGEEADQLGPTVTEAVNDLEDWLVEESPFDVSRADIERFRDEFPETVGDILRSSTGRLASGAVAAVEGVVGVILGLIITFFAIKDGDRFVRWILGLLPPHRREIAGVMGRRAWETVGGYLRGAALLGVVEGIVIGVTIALVGGRLAVPVGALTFILAFIPIVGAIVAGVVAVLVTLATAGGTAALIVLIVVVAVQQLDNDILAPVVYGRTMQLHPVAILLAISAGGALFGVPGTFLAVPITAVAVNVIAEARRFTASVPTVGSDRRDPAS